MTPATRNRLALAGALLVAVGGLTWVAFGNLGENLVYYWTPGEMLKHGEKAHGASIRLGGIVEEGSIVWNEAHTRLEFRVKDGPETGAPSVRVVSTEVPPQMFRAGIGVVVEGTLDASQTFTSNRLMVNHSNEYRAPTEGEKPMDWKDSLEGVEPQAQR